MVSGFRFPPPPPPPPQKAANDVPNQHSYQGGGRGRGRGGASRGRGNHQQGQSRGGFQQRGGHRGGQQNQAPVDAPPPVPVDAGALVQAMAFMATPAGVQSMAAFANHMASGAAGAPNQQPPPAHHQGGVKRKRGERAGQWQAQQQEKQRHAPRAQPSTPKPPKAKAKAAPAVPGFGFTLPPMSAPTPPVASKTAAPNSRDAKRLNLGLTQSNNDESDGEEDMDEEAAFSAKWDGKGITFEHEGNIISLQTGAEVAAYIKDRRRHYPTQARIAEKAQQAAAKRASELEFLQRVRGTTKKERPRDDFRASRQPHKKDAHERPAPIKPSLEQLREKVKQSMATKPAATPATSAIDLGLGYGTDESGDDSSVLSESSVVSSSESSDDSGSESDDDDAPPEAQSSKVAVAPIVPPAPASPPERKPLDLEKAKHKVCPQWKATGKCKFKYCHYKHEEIEPKFVGLYERMVEMELAKADSLALDAIKYLGRNGFLG